MFKLSKNVTFLLLLGAALASILPFFLATPAAACEYEGQSYEPGDTLGPYICMPDGSWKQQ